MVGFLAQGPGALRSVLAWAFTRQLCQEDYYTVPASRQASICSEVAGCCFRVETEQSAEVRPKN